MTTRYLTVDQVVAHNLRRARELRGMTQEESAEALEPYIGRRWSKATWSLAETSDERTDRLRRFSARDVLAFALVFDVPVQWFYLPPHFEDGSGVIVRTNPGREELGTGDLYPGPLLSRVLAGGLEAMVGRVRDLLGAFPKELETPFLTELRQMVQAPFDAAIQSVAKRMKKIRDDLMDRSMGLAAEAGELENLLAEITEEGRRAIAEQATKGGKR